MTILRTFGFRPSMILRRVRATAVAVEATRPVGARAVRAAAAIVALACAPAGDALGAEVVVSSEQALAAMHDVAPSVEPPPRLYLPKEPRRLRPCCAFGGTMRVKLGGIPVPLYRHRPLRGPGDIGPHEYDPGLLQILPSPARLPGQKPAREHNGILYTCRGGFLDTAHIRDFADLTWTLAARVASRLESGGTFELRDLGGARRITIHPVGNALDAAQRRELAIAVAGRLSFELSLWREIVTWYGYESVPPWPEKLSSFSPEDLYSNLLGTKLASGILRHMEIRTELEWDRAMTSWLAAGLAALGVVPVESARVLMDGIDGDWWSSSVSIPNWRITRRRKFDAGPVIEPRLAHASGGGPCERAASPVALRIPDRVGGVATADVFDVHVDVDSGLASGMPLADARAVHLEERNFQRLIEDVRAETEAGLAESAYSTRHAAAR